MSKWQIMKNGVPTGATYDNGDQFGPGDPEFTKPAATKQIIEASLSLVGLTWSIGATYDFNFVGKSDIPEPAVSDG